MYNLSNYQKRNKGLKGEISIGLADMVKNLPPSLFASIDRMKAEVLGVDLDFNRTFDRTS